MRKKIIALILCGIMMLSALCLSGCGTKEKAFVGEWLGNDATWGVVQLTLTEDNIAEFVMIDINSEGTWKYNDDTKSVTVTTDQFTDFEVTEADGSLYFDFSDTKVKLDKVEE